MGTPLTLHGHPRTRTFRVLWVCAELGLDPLCVPTTASEASRSPEHLALNPMGKVPVLDDGGFVLTESMAIGWYLCRRAQSPLLPPGPQAEARVLQWMLWAVSELERPLTTLLLHRAVLPPQRRQPALAEAAEPELLRPLGALEARLADGRTWLLGDDTGFTLADLHAASVLAMGRLAGVDFTRWPRASAWLARCWARPACQAAERLRG